ncbi:probable membrane-associated kinase regulator 6 [Gossypium arboreum]|uniref:Membrane-associated kinase regulator 6 n=1 Tax=Gossypium arboreum TaxID=29729 RepID=A0ABR0MWW5_GOSAR|nr:probable membrane-associated kinase regulator 6 [Gossypium arboreum]KAK5782650.1 hypothetical protein PVK06_037155 [Gossypium arboreum]
METAQPIISIESFSYSWLVNLRPSLDSLDRASFDSASCDETASFIEMDPTMPPSKRFFSNPQDFMFDFPIPQPPSSALALVHADDLFSNGYIAPFFVNPLKMEAYKEVSGSSPTGERSVRHELIPDSKPNCLVCLRKYRIRLSKRMFLKYLGFLITLCRRIRRFNTSKKVETVVGVSVVYNEWRKSFDSENSIYEAVLHCKQSNGK